MGTSFSPNVSALPGLLATPCCYPKLEGIKRTFKVSPTLHSNLPVWLAPTGGALHPGSNQTKYLRAHITRPSHMSPDSHPQSPFLLVSWQAAGPGPREASSETAHACPWPRTHACPHACPWPRAQAPSQPSRHLLPRRKVGAWHRHLPSRRPHCPQSPGSSEWGQAAGMMAILCGPPLRTAVPLGGQLHQDTPRVPVPDSLSGAPPLSPIKEPHLVSKSSLLCPLEASIHPRASGL